MTTQTLTVEQAPALDIDKKLYPERQGRPHPRGVLERRIVWNLFRHLAAAGFLVASVYDGEEDTEVATARAAMELIFNLDDAWVYFHRSPAETAADARRRAEENVEPVNSDEGPSYHWIRLVLGNELDIISDYGIPIATLGEDEGPFGNAVKAFDVEACA